MFFFVLFFHFVWFAIVSLTVSGSSMLHRVDRWVSFLVVVSMVSGAFPFFFM